MNTSVTLITGASSGIGRGLALALAASGTALHLAARDAPALESVAALCRTRGARVDARVIDVTDVEAMTAWIGRIAHLDLVFANAGIAAGTGGGPNGGTRESAQQVRAILATNIDGVMNTVLPALSKMECQPPDAEGVRGRIVILASVAAFLAYPGTPSYCASKAAVDYWTVASAPLARSRGILLTSVCPGFVRSDMTARNQFRMPGLMDADRAVSLILRGVRRGKTRIVFPFWMGLGARFLQLLPPAMIARILMRQKTMEPMADAASAETWTAGLNLADSSESVPQPRSVAWRG
jgi:short-subunit dehydrogenase